MVRNADQAIEFYRRAFGAVELYCSPLPGGKGVHAHLRIANSMVMITDENTESEEMGHLAVGFASPQTLGGTSMLLELLVDDVDAAFQRALDAGAKPALPVSDCFWGDRYAWVTDPFGYIWALATVKEVLTPEQVHQRMMQYMAHMQSAGDRTNCA